MTFLQKYFAKFTVRNIAIGKVVGCSKWGIPFCICLLANS